MDDDAVTLLTKLAEVTSLRYALQLITTANLVALKRKSSTVSIYDIKKVYNLFIDLRRSVELLKQHEKDFMFGEDDADDEACARSRNDTKKKSKSDSGDDNNDKNEEEEDEESEPIVHV